MSLEGESGIDPRKEAAIAGHFQNADRRIRRDPTILHARIKDFLNNFGDVNFATLETIFRKKNFNTHFLAVPANIVEAENPQVLVVDINDLHFTGTMTPRPFVAIAYPGFEDVTISAHLHGMHYNRQRNLRRLKFAGGYTQNPDYKGDLSPLLVVMKPREFFIVPFSRN